MRVLSDVQRNEAGTPGRGSDVCYQVATVVEETVPRSITTCLGDNREKQVRSASSLQELKNEDPL